MYIIHNKTKNTSIHHKGSWPDEFLEKQLNQGDKLIVISLYSNTIKIPYELNYHGIKEWEWDDFPLFKQDFIW